MSKSDGYETIVALILGTAVFSIFLASFIAARAITVIVVISALTTLYVILQQPKTPVPISRPLIVMLILAAMWAAISSSWAVEPHSSILSAGKFLGNQLIGALMFLGFLYLDLKSRRVVEKFFVTGFAILALLLLIELMFKGPIHRALFGFNFVLVGSGPFWLNAALTVLALLVWPIGLIVYKRLGSAWLYLLIPGTLVILYLLGFRSGFFSMSIAVVAAAFVFLIRHRLVPTIIAGALALAVLSAPLVTGILTPEKFLNYTNPPTKSVMHRLYIWKFSADRIYQHPIKGWGMNSSRVMPGGKDLPQDSIYGSYREFLPLHPHNATLQIWLELGLVGAVLLAAMVLTIVVIIFRRARNRVDKAMMTGLLITGLGVMNLSYSIWSSWWSGLIWVAAAITGMIATSNAGNQTHSNPSEFTKDYANI